eukprot:CAMPEP_0174727550 /NCGR_PEP_ID=MMETSP1094-20130205/50023_1 /TAXON_ID=156173 /ORGANISM="Chrysochromulina brevifilum, Strain UTEX LB 985" /LENGTH=70 /DNA_ID=CAMNT_0015929317 /DNA_START=411 /DNA_END=623 /DNA_ORIENTATION=-
MPSAPSPSAVPPSSSSLGLPPTFQEASGLLAIWDLCIGPSPVHGGSAPKRASPPPGKPSAAPREPPLASR